MPDPKKQPTKDEEQPEGETQTVSADVQSEPGHEGSGAGSRPSALDHTVDESAGAKAAEDQRNIGQP